MDQFDIICYHKNCPDGIGGLWAANYYKEIPKHYPLPAGENPYLEEIENKKIIFVDVCPKPDFIIETIEKCSKMVILDHHKTSKEMLESIIERNYPNLEIVFDMGRSGAKIAWEYFFPNRPCPFFISYIEDKDLWRWILPHSQEINFALQSYLKLEDLSSLLEDEEISFQNLLKEGIILKKENDEKIRDISETAVERYFFYRENEVHKVMEVNLLGERGLTSDIGNYLCEKFPDIDFAIIKFRGQDYWSISLRGIKGKCPDLSEIAKKYGGGGHPSASGIRFPDVKTGVSHQIIDKEYRISCLNILSNDMFYKNKQVWSERFCKSIS